MQFEDITLDSFKKKYFRLTVKIIDEMMKIIIAKLFIITPLLGQM